MMDNAPSWCGNGCELREMPAEYFAEAGKREEREERGERKSVNIAGHGQRVARYTLRRSNAPNY